MKQQTAKQSFQNWLMDVDAGKFVDASEAVAAAFYAGFSIGWQQAELSQTKPG